MNNFKDTDIYKKLLKGKTKCYFISPHLDDAVFSAGGLISDLSKKGIYPIVINIFTQPSKKPYTLSVKKFLKSCGYTDAFKLYEDRIKEDFLVLKKVKAKVINLGYTDALWRRKKSNSILKIAEKFIPELGYSHPFFRLTIGKGVYTKGDFELENKISNELKRIIKNDGVIFAPVGVGRHLDHLIARNAVTGNFTNTVYWQDYPYSRTSTANPAFVEKYGLKRYHYNINSKVKSKLLNLYYSQIFAIFGKKKVTIKSSEVYYLNA